MHDLFSFQIHKDPALHFKEIADDICRLTQDQEIKIYPFRDPELPLFRKLSPENQLRSLAKLNCQKIFFEMAQDGNLPFHSPQLLWRALRKMNITPSSDSFDKITEEDTVEIYLEDGGALFKNLRFYTYVSLTLEEIYSLRWYEQIKVSPQLFMFFMEVQTKFRLGYYKTGFVPRIVRSYMVTEKLGHKNRFESRMIWAAPIAEGDKTNAGLLIVSRQVLNPKSRVSTKS